ncbi:NADPH-dependent FMN reductase [Streptomyces sp. GC420]|uniref:NADPH-dependent FMN reductase n=1 Tax=Streptomyces sp. GC420 TaxID=2697568 RepID=UPI0014150DC9|nr:NAD(P)H-dependent oxidoreductase [Streptomyces sp. GC420]NBM18811.1 NADPH-dependent FMN reductase [Streptomyces sp. GC420]
MDTMQPDSRTPLRLAVIVGSNREGRFAPRVADWFRGIAEQRTDLTVDVVDLGGAELPTALSSAPPPAAARSLAAITLALDAAEAFVVITPEYNHSYPSSLKALVDWHFVQWQAKPVAFVSYGGMSGGLRAVEHLRQVFAELHAVTVRDTVSFHNAHGLFAEDGPKDSEGAAGAAGAAKSLLDQVVWWGLALREAKRRRPYTA